MGVRKRESGVRRGALFACGRRAIKEKNVAEFLARGIRIVVVRDLAKVEARVRFPYPAPFPIFSTTVRLATHHLP